MYLRAILVAFLLLPTTGWAEEAGLLVGNARYELAEPLRRGARILRADEDLRGAGLDLQVLEDADRGQLSSALRQLEQQSRSADGILVALSGRFVASYAETFFLPVEAEGASLVDTALSAVPLGAVMGVMAATPGRAVLVLATDDRDTGAAGPGLRHGIGPLDIPPGVTVITATPDAAEEILRETLASGGAAIADGVAAVDDASLQGFVTDALAFLPGRQSRIVSIPPRQTGPDADETDLWNRARRADTEAAYVEYLVAYPDGDFADEAERRLDAFRNDPARRAAATEDSLGLTAAARQEIQRDLVLLGYDTRGIDGVFGPGTRGAIGSWQTRNDRAATGYLDARQIDDIDAQAARRAAELQEEARRRAELEAAAEEAFWAETGQGRDISGLERFLQRYPDGNFAEEARRRLDDMRGADVARAERQAWEQARSADSAGAYAAFLDRFPEGRFSDSARQRLAALGGAAQDGADRQAVATEEALGLNTVTRQAIEQRLAAEGFDPGRVDGRFDDRTRRAIRQYQRRAQLPQSGYLNQITVVRLLADTVRRVLR